MNGSGFVAALVVALVITLFLIVPSLLTVWIYISVGFSREVVITIIVLVFLMALRFTLGLAENE